MNRLCPHATGHVIIAPVLPVLLIDPRALQGKPADVKIYVFSSPGPCFDPRALQGKPADVKLDAFSTSGFVLTPWPYKASPPTSK